jgi:hypothetical protein
MTLALGTKVIYSSTYTGRVVGYGTGAHVSVKLADNRIVFVNPDALHVLGDRGLTDDEVSLLKHISMFGSDGNPVKKCGSRHWSWDYRTISHPRVFPTKREATKSFETFMDILRDAYSGRI